MYSLPTPRLFHSSFYRCQAHGMHPQSPNLFFHEFCFLPKIIEHGILATKGAELGTTLLSFYISIKKLTKDPSRGLSL